MNRDLVAGNGNGEDGGQGSVETQVFLDAGLSLDLFTAESIARFVTVADQYSSTLAQKEDYRHILGRTTPSIWPTLHNIWKVTADTRVTADIALGTQLDGLCSSLAKFTRNLVVANVANQRAAFESEPAIRKLIYYYTSFSVMQNANSCAVTRLLVQTLSNIVTSNEPLIQTIWDLYMILPEEKFILTRSISSPDNRTVSATLIFLLNCLHGSESRAKSAVLNGNGPRLCKAILHRMATAFDAEASSDEGHIFDLCYQILTSLIETGLFPDLYAIVAIEGEAVTPNQTILLKVLDSYLQMLSGDRSAILPTRRKLELVQLLTSAFFFAAEYAQQAMHRSLGPDSTPISGDEPVSQSTGGTTENNVAESHTTQLPPQELDLILPQICEALVLITQCLIAILLLEETAPSHSTSDPKTWQDEARPTKSYLKIAVQSRGFVETLIETLRILDVFVPRITFGKVMPRPTPPGGQGDTFASGPSGSKIADASTPIPPGFSYVKRDLTRLLGILCADDRAVQDRVRACGGIPVVMNLCVVDDQNPYLKEHAIFTLRNLLHGNKENQAVVDAIRPVARYDEYGVLQDV